MKAVFHYNGHEGRRVLKKARGIYFWKCLYFCVLTLNTSQSCSYVRLLQNVRTGAKFSLFGLKKKTSNAACENSALGCTTLVISSCGKILQMCKDQSNRDHRRGGDRNSRQRCEFARVIYNLFHFIFPVLLTPRMAYR